MARGVHVRLPVSLRGRGRGRGPGPWTTGGLLERGPGRPTNRLPQVQETRPHRRLGANPPRRETPDHPPGRVPAPDRASHWVQPPARQHPPTHPTNPAVALPSSQSVTLRRRGHRWYAAILAAETLQSAGHHPSATAASARSVSTSACTTWPPCPDGTLIRQPTPPVQGPKTPRSGPTDPVPHRTGQHGADSAPESASHGCTTRSPSSAPATCTNSPNPSPPDGRRSRSRTSTSPA